MCAAVRVPALLCVAVCISWVSALEVMNTPRAEGAIGEYVTLAFQLQGEGEYSYAVQAQSPWQPLSTSGRVTVSGRGFISVTLRVPRSALPDLPVPVRVTFTNLANEADDVVGQGFVSARPATSVSITAPSQVTGLTDETLEFSIVLTSTGNVADTFVLSGESSMWNVRFSPDRVLLLPGEEVELRVALEPTGSVSSGFRSFVRLRAASMSDPDAVSGARVEATFYLRGISAEPNAARAPRLNLNVGTGLTGRVTLDDTGIDAGLSYYIDPRLTGDVSDYVRAAAYAGRIAGSIDDPFAETPSGFHLGLSAEDWDAAMSLQSGAYSVSGGALVGDWRLGGAAGLTTGGGEVAGGVSAHAASQNPNLDLQLGASTRFSNAGRTDGVSAVYRTLLGDSLQLTMGGLVSGFQTPGEYYVALGLFESITYQNQLFDVTQTYAGSPLTGTHAIGLNGGLRSAGPFGVRASTTYQFGPNTYQWRNTLTLSSAPMPGLGISVSGTWEDSTTRAVWSVRPTLSYGARLGQTQLRLTVGYAHTGIVRGDFAVTDSFTAGAAVGSGPFSVTLGASYLLAGPTLEQAAGSRLGTQAGVSFRPRSNTLAQATYEYVIDGFDQVTTSQLGVTWTEAWSPRVSTLLSYERSHSQGFEGGAYSQGERIALVGQLRNVGLDGLNLSAGYSLSAQAGLFTGIEPLRHDFSARASYTLRLSFDTPEAIVSLFGGRRGGELRGVAFIDRNMNGVQEENEPPLAGVVLNLGGVSVETDNTGLYTVRAPAGRWPWSFGSGLPAGLSFAGEVNIEIEDNTAQLVHLPFIPVVTLSVLLFDDEDNDATRSGEEGGISFGGVIVEGPVTRAASADSRGVAVIGNLVPGTYTVRPDPNRLPPRYRQTTEPVTVTLQEGQRSVSVEVGAGAPPRQVTTTFTHGSIGVIARTNTAQVSPGGQIQVTALVSGPVERVVVQLAGQQHALTNAGGMWTGDVPIPEDAPPGRLELIVVASGADQTTSVTVDVTIR